MIGLAAAAVAAADLNGLTSVLPPEVAKWVLSAGLFAAALKNGILFVGDLLDNGKQDGSFKLQAVALPFLALAALTLPSCSGIGVTEDGCVLAAHRHEGNTYFAGPCVGPDGQVNRFRVQWQNATGDRLRATYPLNGSAARAVIEYQASGGLWVRWDGKSGVLLGPTPPELPGSVPAMKTTPPASPAPAVVPAK